MINSDSNRHNFRSFLLFCGIILFALTSFINDDFFHYYETMGEYKNGVMDQTIAGYNALPQEQLKSKEQVKSAVEELLKSKDFVVNVFDYSIENFHNRG